MQWQVIFHHLSMIYSCFTLPFHFETYTNRIALNSSLLHTWFRIVYYYTTWQKLCRFLLILDLDVRSNTFTFIRKQLWKYANIFAMGSALFRHSIDHKLDITNNFIELYNTFVKLYQKHQLAISKLLKKHAIMHLDDAFHLYYEYLPTWTESKSSKTSHRSSI